MNIRCERDHKRSLRRIARGVRWQESAVSEKLWKELISKRRMWSTVSCKRNCKKHLSTVILQRSVWMVGAEAILGKLTERRLWTADHKWRAHSQKVRLQREWEKEA